MENENIKSASRSSYLGLGFMAIFLMAWIFEFNNPIFIGFLSLTIAVLFMNGLAQIDMLIDKESPNWWKNNKLLSLLHDIQAEGELAGILVGIILYIYIVTHGQASHVHLPFYAAAALGGIMAAANIATHKIIPLMNKLERVVGVWGAVWIGSMLSTLTGAASSVFVSEYLLPKVDKKTKNEVALRLSAGIGLGNGILPFVAPPVLIVWASLQEKLGWGLLDLFLMVGIIGVIYSGYITYRIKDLVITVDTTKGTITSIFSFELLVLLVVIIGNIVAYTTSYMLIVNLVVSVAGVLIGKDFNTKWQPFILGTLLIALEIIGHMAEPFVHSVITTILPKDMPIILLGLTLFFISAWTSHIADNALASRILIGTLFGMGYIGMEMDFLVASVLIGALFGGFLLIPANLPNFPIARIFAISSGDWFKAALKIYWTTIIPIVWIVIIYFILI